ncbi:hypothetical protein CEXT_76051 [Caerostris extrusa]|uniref:Uncharacterized protein n=1 Tax=Caerostris extrusa TaxID=172846 RepID=A0AAV4T8L2_CAEEX|nr:hypothetical protein CEXT_76051 [Caerostris extrusa]
MQIITVSQASVLSSTTLCKNRLLATADIRNKFCNCLPSDAEKLKYSHGIFTHEVSLLCDWLQCLQSLHNIANALSHLLHCHAMPS